MTDKTDRAPWCPRCGGEMVRVTTHKRFGEPLWLARCKGCGFGCEDDFTTKADAGAEARILIRAELSRQALEMRAHSQAHEKPDSLDLSMMLVLHQYNWLGAHPLRLPGEGASA